MLRFSNVFAILLLFTLLPSSVPANSQKIYKATKSFNKAAKGVGRATRIPLSKRNRNIFKKSGKTFSSQKTTRAGRKVMNSSQARRVASNLGYRQVSSFPSSMRNGSYRIQSNTPVFKGTLPNSNKATYISPDSGGHRFDNGWKVWNNSGTFFGHGNHNLTQFK